MIANRNYGSVIMDGTYGAMITDGNYGSVITHGNYSSMITDRNRGPMISDGNYMLVITGPYHFDGSTDNRMLSLREVCRNMRDLLVIESVEIVLVVEWEWFILAHLVKYGDQDV